jgi:hypothetical protein
MRPYSRAALALPFADTFGPRVGCKRIDLRSLWAVRDAVRVHDGPVLERGVSGIRRSSVENHGALTVPGRDNHEGRSNRYNWPYAGPSDHPTSEFDCRRYG